MTNVIAFCAAVVLAVSIGLGVLTGCATPPSDEDCKTWKEICAERHQKRHSGSCQNYRNLCEL